ncbi:NADPH-dependent FMN reductase family protein [Streptomyces rimosus]|uniref:hypothetical protein n=1 Tax=Streptomyces rimosus TaxID=1927 RepID=UPI00067ACACD|nr:hypothetical protein [Streptomyces rimosus]
MTTPAPSASSAASPSPASPAVAVPPVVAVAYHSGFGHTAVLAEAVRDGAADAGATVHLVKVDEITEEQLPGWNSSTASENDLNRLGIFLGAGAQTDSDRGPDGVHKADIATADHLGRRVAAQAAVYAAGRAAVAA